jgi:DNA gyrase/topoisomerase IV subunit B
MPTDQGPGKYDADSIVVLEGLEAVRRRPAMYLSADPFDALVLAIVGGMCLSLEAVAVRRASEVVLTTGSGLAFQVADDGAFAGLLDAHPTAGCSLGEAVLSVLLACRDLKDGELLNLCEVPIVVPNALSRRTTLSVAAGGAWWSLEFRNGKLISGFARGGTADAGGVRVGFDLDPVFFPGTQLDDAVVGAVLRKVKALVPCARVIVAREGAPARPAPTR